jgi:hypothetical protein
MPPAAKVSRGVVGARECGRIFASLCQPPCCDVYADNTGCCSSSDPIVKTACAESLRLATQHTQQDSPMTSRTLLTAHLAATDTSNSNTPPAQDEGGDDIDSSAVDGEDDSEDEGQFAVCVAACDKNNYKRLDCEGKTTFLRCNPHGGTIESSRTMIAFGNAHM